MIVDISQTAIILTEQTFQSRWNTHLTMFIRNTLLIVLGWLCILLGFIGAFLPVLPTTPFLILALSLFAKSSPRFHQMLLDNPWFGPSLQQWEESKTVTTKSKWRAIILIICTFSLSIYMVSHTWQLQVMLLVICCILLCFMSRLKTQNATTCAQTIKN